MSRNKYDDRKYTPKYSFSLTFFLQDVILSLPTLGACKQHAKLQRAQRRDMPRIEVL